MEGTVKWFNLRKGYGFIQGEDGEDYFVHYRALPEGVKLRDNDRVSFEPADTDRGKQARNVTLRQKASERTDLPESQEREEAPAEESETGEAAEEEQNLEEEPQEGD